MSNCFVSCITTILKLSSDFLIVCLTTYLLSDLSRLFYLLSQRSLITLLVIKFSNFLLLTIFHVDSTSFLKYISPVASLIFYFILFYFFAYFSGFPSSFLNIPPLALILPLNARILLILRSSLDNSFFFFFLNTFDLTMSYNCHFFVYFLLSKAKFC